MHGENIKAFPPGFRLLAGDNLKRDFTSELPEPPKSLWSGHELTQQSLAEKALGFNCLYYQYHQLTDNPGVPPKPDEGTLQRHFMPDKRFLDTNCKDGLRMELMFPSCWNGRDLDTADHKSHMAYPTTVIDGQCPPGFDVRLPSLLYETKWNTQAFEGVDGQFVISNGDPTGKQASLRPR